MSHYKSLNAVLLSYSMLVRIWHLKCVVIVNQMSRERKKYTVAIIICPIVNKEIMYITDTRDFGEKVPLKPLYPVT